VAGLYGYMFGGALFASTAFMTIQATGAMSIIVTDIDLASRDDPARSLFTLTIVTGVAMVIAGALRSVSFLRFVSNSVMTGFDRWFAGGARAQDRELSDVGRFFLDRCHLGLRVA
jgi:SulP family sulfate permease